VILTSTEPQIQGYWITSYKGIVQGETWDDLLRRAEELGANAVLNTRFDDALDVETLFHGSAVVLKPACAPRRVLPRPQRRIISRANQSDQ
jgi:uncharacterized protein YbjQ (UPF0145 family)